MPAMRFPVMVAAVAVCLSAMEMRVEAVTMVAAGWRHSVALDDDGRLRAWGEGRMGQTGNGEFATADRPVTVVGPDGEGALTGVVSVAAGLFHTLAIREDGSVWAWGANSFGQLGNGRWGPDAHSAVPVQVLGLDGEGHLEGAIAVSGGWDHSVALLEDGTVVAWGSRCQGQLGDGLRDSNSWSEHPVRVRGPNGEGRLGGGTALACGAHHTVVLREDGTLLAWGGNFEGQLGRGHTGDRGRMHRVSFELAWTPPTAGHWSIALGYTYTDPSHRDAADRVELVDEFDGPPLEVVTEATAADRRTGRFSRDENHVLMRATLTYPARAPVGESVVLELEEILVGLNTADDDFAEEIHLLLTNRETGEQVRLDAGDGTALALARPAPVIGPDGDGVLEDILAVAAGVYHTVALREDGSVWAWGHNSTGQLGDGTRGTTATPVQMAAGEQGEGHLERIAAVAAGFESSYALGEDGRVWACGWNVYGQLGAALPASAATGHPEIRQVVTGSETAGPLEEITAIAAGTYHALARNASGDLLAWGHNGFGQLGDGTVRDRASAVPVVALESGFEPEPPRLPTGVAPPAPVVDLQHAEVDAAAGNVLNVLEHGAKGDGVHLDWEALQGAIDAAHEAGGGVVLLPPGTYRTGSLELLGGVRLHLEEGATLLGSTNRDHYQRGRARPGVIWAEGADNIAITGQGVIDGQGQFCPNRGWRHRILSIHDCSNIVVEGISTVNAGSWTQHWVNCRDLTIRGITVNSVRPRRNNDGIDLSGCQDVLIEGCIVASEDDAIVIKSQRADLVNRNIRAVNNTVYTMCNGYKLGTETRGDFESMVCEDLRAFGGSTLAVWSVDGSRVRGVRISKVRGADSRFALGVRLGARLRDSYFAEGEERVPGIMEDVVMRDIEIEMSERSFRDTLLDHGIENAEIAHQLVARPAAAAFISGLPGHPVRRVVLEDVRISHPGGGTEDEGLIEVPERPAAYPNAAMFGRLPAWGLYLRDAEGITLRNLMLELRAPDGRPPVKNENLAEGELAIEGLSVHEAWR